MGELNIIGAVLVNSGVPKQILRFTQGYTPLYAAAPYNKNGESKQLSPAKQADFVNNTHISLKTPKRILIYSSDNIDCARAIAVRMLLEFIGKPTKPVWHLPSDEFGIKNDPLLAQLKLGAKVPLIVLDNLSTFMGTSKCEKITATLALADCPVLLIINGKKPFNFCVDRLGFYPDFIIRPELNVKRVQTDKSERF